jgi:cytochrome b561
VSAISVPVEGKIPMHSASDRYDSRSVALHWVTAIMVVAQWLGAHAIDMFPKGPLRVDARSTHIAIGVALLAVVIARLAWRFTHAQRPALPGPAPVRTAAVTMHWMLYGLVIAVLFIGALNVAVCGDSIFGLFKIPAIDPQNKALRAQVGDIHEWLANILLLAAGLHAIAALIHDRLWHRGSLARMIPALRKSR